MKRYVIASESELAGVSAEIIPLLKHNIVLLDGDMGTGKTTFVKYFIRALTSYSGVTSPTFSIINEYQNQDNKPIYHMDLYRLESMDEALNIGIEEYLDSEHLCLIEWPNLIVDLLPEKHHRISFELTDDNSRTLLFS